MTNTASPTTPSLHRSPAEKACVLQIQSQMENLQTVCGEWRFPEMLVIESEASQLSAHLAGWPQQDRITSWPVDHAAARLPFENGRFDVVVLSRQLQAAERPLNLLKELARVAAFQVIEVPVCDTAQLDAYSADLASQGVVNIFTPSLLRFQLHRAGLEVLCDRTATRRTPGQPRAGWLRVLSRRFNRLERCYTVLTQPSRVLRIADL